MKTIGNNCFCRKENIGNIAFDLIKNLFPICRSITGNGVRETLNILKRHIPIEIIEVESGSKVFDWTVPHEWNIRDAYIKDSKGKKVIDFKKSNLHVMSYSTPVKKKIKYDELKKHLHSLKDYPDWIPYKTTYYKKNWAFCVSHKQYLALKDGEYDVFIDTSLKNGFLTYGEYYIKGNTKNEIIISTHICHPSMANDNLSGISITTLLAKKLIKNINNRYSYRFLFVPGTIGAITWLNNNFETIHRIKHGLVICGIGDKGKLTYKKSRRGNAEIDNISNYILKMNDPKNRILEFDPYGYDERQYCSPGFNLAVGRLSRTPYGEYPEYHTSADNLNFIKKEKLEESFNVILDIINMLERNIVYENTSPYCEPQLGKRSLYEAIGPNQMAMLWVLNLSDQKHSLLDIANISGIEFEKIYDIAQILCENKLLRAVKN